MLFSHDWTISPECEQDGLWAGDNILFVPNQLLGKNYIIYCRSAQLCTRSTVLALDTRSTVLKFQNNRASKFQKRCSQHPVQIFLEKRQNSSKVTKMHPFLTLTNAKSSSSSFFFFFYKSPNFNPFQITVFSFMMLLQGAQKQPCSPVWSSAKGTLSSSSTTSSGHHVNDKRKLCQKHKESKDWVLSPQCQ